MSLSDVIRQQALAWTSMPVSFSRLLASAADASAAAVGLLQQMERQQAASTRVLEAVEGPLVRLADAVDGAVVQQAVDALGRLPGILEQAALLSSRAESLLSSVESPLRALGPLGQALEGTRVAELVERIDQSLPGLGRLPQTENDVQLLRETTDRLYRLAEDVQGRFSMIPGASLLLGRGHRDAPAAASDAPGAGAARADAAADTDAAAQPEAAAAEEPPLPGSGPGGPSGSSGAARKRAAGAAERPAPRRPGAGRRPST